MAHDRTSADLPDLASLRHEYAARGLAEDELTEDPMTMFGQWFDEARSAGLGEPNAMVVSTVSEQGRPSSRTVLLKGVEQDPPAFCFYTNLGSRKGAELAGNPHCSLLFPWHDLERQVRVEGTAAAMSRGESQAYFSRRPRGSRLGAWSSPQSSPVGSRADLDRRYAEVEARFDGVEDIEVPPFWGGYRVTAYALELWQGRPSRMHDRLRYERDEGSVDGPWRVTRLAP